MENWTKIIASIELETNIYRDNLKEYFELVMENAPKITGDILNAEVFINHPSGHNVRIFPDCEHCEHYDGETEDGEYIYCSKKGVNVMNCPSGKYQTNIIITVVGHLKNRTVEITTKEWKSFKDFVFNLGAGAYKIINYSCNIE